MLSCQNRWLFANLLGSNVIRTFCYNVRGKRGPSAKPPKKIFGQPTHESHPQLLSEGEITPLIRREEFQERRERLLEQLVSNSRARDLDVRQHLVVIPSASKKYMSDKIPYLFRQNTDFLYLTGCQEPDSCLVLMVDDSGSHCSTMFLRERDDNSELWDGPRTGPNLAPIFFGVDRGLPTSELENYLQLFAKSHSAFFLWYDYMHPPHGGFHKTMVDYIGIARHKLLESPRFFVDKQRLIKSTAEIELMRQSCDIASEAIIKTIEASHSGVNESQIFAKVDYECRMNGAEHLAYPPVVAGGDRATIIHYIDNNQVVRDGEMVLMDAGCEYHGYSSDVTRTWPVSGSFTPEQRELYEIVFDVQAQLIQLCNDFPTLDYLFDSMCMMLGKRLQEIGLISKLLTDEALFKMAYQFCPHHVSHYLGMDVHDTPSVTRSIKIRPGMIITIEPGIYISQKFQVPKEYVGMGIRIEDDVLITDEGPIVLTKNCPKVVDSIESITRR